MIRHYILTLDGTVQRLSSVLPEGAAPLESQLRLVSLTAHQGNSNPIFVGGESPTVSEDSWGFRIPAPASAEPAAPLVLGEFTSCGPMKLSDFYVLGTSTEKLMIAVLPFE